MLVSKNLRRRDAQRRFVARKLRRLLECDDSTVAEIARTIDQVDGLGDHLREAVPPGVSASRRTDEVICRLGLLRAERLIRNYWLRPSSAVRPTERT